jgi:hypothetical protein
VNITDYLPDEVNFISADSNGIYDPCSHSVTWNLGTLEPNMSGSFNLTVELKTGISYLGITVINHCELRSGDLILNEAFADVEVANITFEKQNNVPYGGYVVPDSNVSYSIYYDANGYADTNVVIADYLPNEVNFISADSGGVYDPCYHSIQWNIGTLDANDSGSVSLTVKVKALPDYCLLFTNQAEIQGNIISNNAIEKTAAARSAKDAYKCGWVLLGDLNADCIVNFLDLAVVCLDWWRCNEQSDPSCEKL